MTIEEWIAQYGLAWRTKNVDAVVDLFAPDAVYRSSPTSSPHVGRTAIGDYWREATRTQEDVTLVFGTPLIHGGRVAVEWWATMRDPAWRPDAPTSEVTLPGCLVLRMRPDGRCVELREYYNPLFGSTVTPPPGWGV